VCVCGWVEWEEGRREGIIKLRKKTGSNDFWLGTRDVCYALVFGA